MNYHSNKEDNIATLSNAPLSFSLSESERDEMKRSAAKKIEELFDILLIDHKNDHNTRETPIRVARLFIDEILRGRFCEPPPITEFMNVNDYDQLIVTGPIQLRSTCAHHLMPIYGHAIIGVLPSPGGNIIGLSKYDRIVDHFASRLQIQEELIMQIERHIVDATRPRGLAVRINAVHMCKCHRGVKASRSSRMINNSYYGLLADHSELRNEFLQEVATLERSLGD